MSLLMQQATPPRRISQISGSRTVLSSLGSNTPITAAFVLLSISLNLSIFGSRLLMFKRIRRGPLLLKACHSSCLNDSGLLKGLVFRLISRESRSNKRENMNYHFSI